MLFIFVVLNLGLLFLEKAAVFMILRRYRSRGYNCWSLWVDTKIIFRTAWVMLTGSGR
jgi:lipopolysaccharide/colanic/teichoic acid biosynthesis glycosyltransferase